MKKKQQACKPGSVLCLREVFVIYLGHKSPYASSNLPPGIGRAILHAPVYMILQPIRCTATIVTNATGKLLPHLFTLIPPLARRLFSVTLLCSREQLPVRKYGALCCPDFPPYQNDKATNRLAISIQRYGFYFKLFSMMNR